MTTKSTPKSCSCGMCSNSKRTPSGQQDMKKDERAFRRTANAATRRGGEDVLAAGVRRRVG